MQEIIGVPLSEVPEELIAYSFPTGIEKKGMKLQLGNKAFIYAMNTDGAAHVALTPYRMDLEHSQTGGWTAKALADDVNVYMIGVAIDAVAASAWGWYQVEGPISNVIVTSDNFTAGHGLEITSNTVVDSDAAYAWTSHASTDFAMVNEAGTGVAAIDIILTGKMATAQT